MLARPVQNLLDVGWGRGESDDETLILVLSFFLFCSFSKGQSTSKIPLESSQILRPRFSACQTNPNPLWWGSWPLEVVFKTKTIGSSPLASEYLQYLVFFECMYVFSPWTEHGLKDSRWICLLMVSLTCLCPWRCENAYANPWLVNLLGLFTLQSSGHLVAFS